MIRWACIWTSTPISYNIYSYRICTEVLLTSSKPLEGMFGLVARFYRRLKIIKFAWLSLLCTKMPITVMHKEIMHKKSFTDTRKKMRIGQCCQESWKCVMHTLGFSHLNLLFIFLYNVSIQYITDTINKITKEYNYCSKHRQEKHIFC